MFALKRVLRTSIPSLKRIGSILPIISYFSVKKPTVSVNFITSEKEKIIVEGEIGKTILQIAHENKIGLEGACEGGVACGTCHVIFEESMFKKLKPPTQREEDTLDLVFNVQPTSRLACQVLLTKELENANIILPKSTRNIYVGGAKPKIH